MTATGLRLREGRAPVRERLTAMLFLAALLHAIIILGVGFTSSLRSTPDTPPLDVLLVTDQLPEAHDNTDAAYLAQRTQIGSGNSDARRPAAAAASRGARTADQGLRDSGNAADTGDSRELTAAGGTRMLYLGTEHTSAAAFSAPLGELPGPPQAGRGDAELLLRGRRNNEHWVAPDTRASQLAPYLVAWKGKIERLGTLNFPIIAHHRPGTNPVVEVEIDADGRLRTAYVRRSSGDGALDAAALSILKLASPFERFPPHMAAQYARLRFAYEWDFVTDEGVSSVPTAPASAPSSGSGPVGAVTPSSEGTSGP